LKLGPRPTPALIMHYFFVFEQLQAYFEVFGGYLKGANIDMSFEEVGTYKLSKFTKRISQNLNNRDVFTVRNNLRGPSSR